MSFPKDCWHPAGTCGDGEEMQAGAPARRGKREQPVPQLQRGPQPAGCGVSGISVRCLQGHWLPFLLPVAATACVGMPPSVAWQKGPPGSDTTHRLPKLTASPGASWEAPQNSLGAGTPTLGGLPPADAGPHPMTDAPRRQHGSRPQRGVMGIARVMQGQQSSKRCLGLLRGPRGSQGLETQQPHRQHGAALAAGGLVKEKGKHPP